MRACAACLILAPVRFSRSLCVQHVDGQPESSIARTKVVYKDQNPVFNEVNPLTPYTAVHAPPHCGRRRACALVQHTIRL